MTPEFGGKLVAAAGRRKTANSVTLVSGDGKSPGLVSVKANFVPVASVGAKLVVMVIPEATIPKRGAAAAELLLAVFIVAFIGPLPPPVKDPSSSMICCCSCYCCFEVVLGVRQDFRPTG